MTQAFNLSQLANGVNTSGQVNASSYLYNQVPVANGGTALSSAGAAGNMLLATSASAYASVTMPTFGFRNRIINGAMIIDQRNAGALITQSTSSQFPVDRWFVAGDVASKFTAQQSAVAPAGFINSLLITSSSAYTVGATESFILTQYVEGLNVADFGWGTANAAPITVSFWVRSSLTGTFGGVVRNSANNRSYPFSYTISAANTLQQKSITIAGDTTGTWLTTNGRGLNLTFSMGCGSTFSGTEGAWAAANYVSATGATSLVGTNGATFYITGVQLEKGSTATSFDYRDYGRELALCQRYYEVGAAKTFIQGGAGLTFAISYHVSKRATGATITTGTAPAGTTVAPTTIDYSGIDSFWVFRNTGGEMAFSWTSAVEL